jgi:2-C-methyl-D-erythritol 4-phosphate cytidylyltransferase
VRDKVLAAVAGRPVFAYSAAAFAASGVADLYVVVYRDRSQMTALSAFAPTPSLLVRGGRERQDSVMAALAGPSRRHRPRLHPRLRPPLIRPEQLVALHKVVRREGAVVLAHRSPTRSRERRADGRLRTLDRSRLWAMETPQVFSRDLIVRAYAAVRRRRLVVTDDAAAVELLGHPVALLENTHSNLKLTTPKDLDYLEFLLAPAQLRLGQEAHALSASATATTSTGRSRAGRSSCAA